MIDGLLNSQDLGSSDEEVVRKAKRPNLNWSIKCGKRSISNRNEGLILKKIIKNRTNILRLTSEINSLSDKEDKLN